MAAGRTHAIISAEYVSPTVRRPSDRDTLYAWWRAALEALGGYADLKDAAAAGVEIPPIFEDEPQCGYFKSRAGRERPWMPARIFLEQHLDKNGELTQPERLRCQIGDDFVEPGETWAFLCVRPITQRRYEYMCAVRDWALDFAPDAPEANPNRPINYLTRPLPVFKKQRNAR